MTLRGHQMRKAVKAKARASLRSHYWMMVVLCLVMAMIGIGYTSSLTLIKTDVFGVQKQNSTVLSKAADNLVPDDTPEEAVNPTDQDRTLGLLSIEHSRGVFAKFANSSSSDQILTTIRDAVTTVSKSQQFGLVMLVLAAVAWTIFNRFFLLNVFAVLFNRYFLEARLYKDIPLTRFFYLVRLRRWFKVAFVMLVRQVFNILWYLTIIGGFIKAYSYMLVPYIIAENPDLSPKQAITLSRHMMNGHKWEAFVLNLSFILWEILGSFTAGLTDIFFVNPYMEATHSEYYAHLRKLAKESNIPGVDLLNDTYLFEKADPILLAETYGDVLDIAAPEQMEDYLAPVAEKTENPVLRFLRNVFGVVLFFDESENAYEKRNANRDRLYNFTQTMKGNAYPVRLFPMTEKYRVREMSSIHFDRHYQVTSLILMFFFMCFIGWAWEVSLHLISDGEFVNRGVMHGPWLPIYGSGCIMILLILNKFRTSPPTEFVMAVLLCGTLEYFSGYFLEITHDGQKWWDYSGYFLNIHGRVCGEGLLVFGLGGLAFVYLLAPFLDNMFRRIPFKTAVIVCAILLTCYIGDSIYSAKYPNAGPGVTNYQPATVADIGSEKI